MKEWLIEFAQTPAGSIICGGALMIALSLVIFSKTSVGKKTLNALTQRANLVETKLTSNETNFAQLKQEVERLISLAQTTIDTKALKQDAKIKELETLVKSMGKTINNAKIKDIVSRYEQDHETMTKID